MIVQLSPNFSLHEMTKSDTALRNNLDNNPKADEVANLKRLCEIILQPIRNHYAKGVKINSGYRSPSVNKAAGGSTTSDHCKGMAADIEIPGIANADLANFIKDNFEFTQLILEFYTPGIPDSGWVHVSYNPSNLKKQCLTAVKKNKETHYLPGLIA